MTSKDSKRCVDKTQIGEDVIGTLTMIGGILLICFIIGATGYTAHIVGAKLMRLEPCVEISPQDPDYLYREYYRGSCGNPYRPTFSGDSFFAVLSGIMVLLFVLVGLVVVIQALVDAYDRYYPLCRDLKKRDKERCKKTKQAKK